MTLAYQRTDDGYFLTEMREKSPFEKDSLMVRHGGASDVICNTTFWK